MHLRTLKQKSPRELAQHAEEVGVANPGTLPKQQAILAILKHVAAQQETITAEGTLEIMRDGFGYLRTIESNYLAAPDDIYVSPQQIKRNLLQTGDTIEGTILPPRFNDQYFSLGVISQVNGTSVDNAKRRLSFDNLTALYPQERLKLAVDGSKENSTRVVDIITPIGKGQRALIVAPPRTGKTVLLQNIAQSISANYPDITLLVLLIDERPEEVTDMKRNTKAEVISSTFDEPATRHVQVAEMVIQRAKRLVELGKDVVILLDSITRLARAFNATAPSSGKILSGGIDSNALQRPKRFFGAARNIEEGGSLTIIGTALVETGSRMDEVIFEEFKGTGNSEIVLDRKLGDKRVFPAIDIIRSGTRKEEVLVDDAILARMWILRRVVQQMSPSDAMEFVLEKLRATKTNEEFFKFMN